MRARRMASTGRIMAGVTTIIRAIVVADMGPPQVHTKLRSYSHATCEAIGSDICQSTVDFSVSRNPLSDKGRFMGIGDQIQKDMVEAMRGREELRLSTLRMMKAAIKNKEIEKRAPLDEKESQQILATMIKQRRDSIEQFQKGGRQELADKEDAEIALIENYLPKAVGEEEITAAVKATIAEMGSPTMKDMGTVMK